ncbi:hypothetical protein NDU88_010068 [Pleurodeles waltl]|uniref:Uncharacterized protein n=1 Tax=Pleurodeles waltl TaxID=8319 RepID=A0AAV7Q148_PLEWA|nr:hypothetical protein NDU88_010068 [Pleurodeles waltl]
MEARTGVVVSDESWRQDEEEKIKARKEYFDRKKSSRATKVKVGDWVLIRKPVGVRVEFSGDDQNVRSVEKLAVDGAGWGLCNK